MDFMRDILRGNRAFRALTIVDTCTRECVAIEIDVSLSGKRVVNVLERFAATRGLPRTIVVDNGPEFHSRALDAWAHGRGVELQFIRPGKPIDNAFIEAFNSRFRDECLNQHWVPHARRRARHDRALAHPLQHGRDRTAPSSASLPPSMQNR